MWWSWGRGIAIVIGLAFLGFGVVLIRYRAAIYRYYKAYRKAMYGERLENWLAGNDSPATEAGIPGVICVIIGLITLLVSIFAGAR